MRFLEAWLFGVGPSDPLTFGVSVCVLLAVTLIAGYLPARRATASDQPYRVLLRLWTRQLLLRDAEPLVVDLLIGTILTKRNQRAVNLLTQGTIQLQLDSYRLTIKYGTDYLHPSFPFMRPIVKEQR